MSTVTSDSAPLVLPLSIGGEPVLTGEWLEVRSPFSGALVTRAAAGGAEFAARAVSAAAEAMREPLPVETRQRILTAIAAEIDCRREKIAALLSREIGKPLKAGLVEADRAAATFRRAGEEALRLGGEAIPLSDGADGRAPKIALTVRKPVGVVAAITPFNFPLNLAAHKVAPALAAGCAVVLKPAEKAPGAASLLARIAADAGLPPGWLNVVVGPPAELAGALLADERVALVSFTGSSSVGWELAAKAPRKRVALELGNVTPVIVEPDANLDHAAEKIVASGFGFAGQTCISAQRVLAHGEIVDALLERALPLVEALRCGDPADPETDVGPLITAVAGERALGSIEEATNGGGRLLTGGTMVGPVLAPTLLRDPPSDCRLLREEAFAPVVCVTEYRELEQAITAANSTAFGLQAAIFTSATASATRAARELRFGAVIVNDSPSFRQDQMPYGGVKASGNTREGPGRAVLEMTEECLLVLDG